MFYTLRPYASMLGGECGRSGTFGLGSIKNGLDPYAVCPTRKGLFCKNEWVYPTRTRLFCENEWGKFPLLALEIVLKVKSPKIFEE